MPNYSLGIIPLILRDFYNELCPGAPSLRGISYSNSLQRAHRSFVLEVTPHPDYGEAKNNRMKPLELTLQHNVQISRGGGLKLERASGFLAVLRRPLFLKMAIGLCLQVNRIDWKGDALFFKPSLQTFNKFMLDQKVVDKFPRAQDHCKANARLAKGVISDKGFKA